MKQKKVVGLDELFIGIVNDTYSSNFFMMLQHYVFTDFWYVMENKYFPQHHHFQLWQIASLKINSN